MADGEVTLRAATAADGPAIGAIKMDTWRHAYAGVLPAPVLDGLDAAQESADWGAYAHDTPAEHRLIVAVRGREVIGYGRSEPCPDADLAGAGEVAGLYVQPSAQSTGAGRVMLAWLVDDLAARTFDPIVLWHFVGNERAAAVYAAAGFEPDGARRPVPGLDVDEVRLRLLR
jgi:GNAT superfamily N-acetyltransferase